MEPLNHSCPSPLIQNSESVTPSWLQRMKDEEEELEEAMATALGSGTAYYLDSTDDSTMTDTLQAPSVNTSSSTCAPPSSDPDAAFEPNSTVRIIKPLPNRSLKSRFPDAVRVLKPLPKRTLKPHIKPQQMSEARSLSDPEPQPLIVEGSATPSSLTYIPPSSPSGLISDHDMGGSEDLTISDTVRVIKPLPKRMSRDHSFNDPGTHPLVVEVSMTPSPPTYIQHSNGTPEHDIGGSKNQTLITTRASYHSSDQNTCPANAVAGGLATSLTPLPSPIRPIDNGIASFSATTPPHNSKALSDPMAGASTPMDSLSVPFTSSPAALAQPTSFTPSKSLPPVSYNRSRFKLPQTPTDASDNDEDFNALINKFLKGRIVWADDDPDPIPVTQPTVPLQTSKHQERSTDNHGVATLIPPGNMIVDLTETTTSVQSIHELNRSEVVSEYDVNMSNTSFQNTVNSNNNSFTVDDSNFSIYETNYIQFSDTITSAFEPNVSSNEPSLFSESSTSLSELDSIPDQLDSDANMGVVGHQPSWQQGFDNDHIPSVERYNSDPTYHSANSPKSTLIKVDNQQSHTQASASSEADNYAMNWDESDTGLPNSIVFSGLKGLLAAKQSRADFVEDPTVYGTLLDQADPRDAIGPILGLSNTMSSKTLGEVNELNEIAAEDTTAAPTSGNMFLEKSRTPTFSPNLLPSSENENSFTDDFDTHLHYESSSLQVRHLSLELSNNESEPSVAHNPIPTGKLNTTNDVPIFQTPVHPDDPGQTCVNLDTNYTSEDSSGDESLEEVQIGERHNRIHEPVDATEFTTGKTEESNPNSELAQANITVDNSTSSNMQSQSTSVPHSEFSLNLLGHYPTLSLKEREQSDPVPSKSPPANDIELSSKRGQITAGSNSKNSDTSSVDESSSSSEPISLSATLSTPVITITPCQSRTQSPPIHTSPAFLTPFLRPRSPASPILPPAVSDNSDVPAPADIACAPCIEVSTTVESQAFDTVTPTVVTASQSSTTHVPSALYQDIPIFDDHVIFDAWNSFVPLAPVPDVHASFVYEPSDIDMCPETSSYPSHVPHHYPIAKNTSFNAPEMCAREDMQQAPDEDDRMDDEQMTFSNCLHGQSLQDSEMRSPGGCYAEGDVGMGDSILPEPEVAHEVTPMDIDPSITDVAATFEAPVDTLPRTTGIQNKPLPMTISPLHPQFLVGDMFAFVQEISAVVKTLDSLTSLELEAQTVAAIRSTATQLASAANMQPMAYERVLKSPESEAPAYQPSTTELSSDTPDKDEFSSIDSNSGEKETAQSEDIDGNVHLNHLPDYETESNIRSGSNLKRGLRKYGLWSMDNDASWSTFPHNGGETQITDRDDSDFMRTARVSSAIKTKNLNFRGSSTGISPLRTRFRVRLAVDILNTRLTFGTETSEPQFQSSAQSTTLRMEVSSHTKSIPELSTSATQLDKAVETPSYWGKLWGVLTSIF